MKPEEEFMEEIKPYLTNDLRDELIEVLDIIKGGCSNFDNGTPDDRREILERIWLQVKQKRIDAVYNGFRNFRCGMSFNKQIALLADVSGFGPGELKTMYIHQFGDIGNLAYFCLTHKKQNDLKCFDGK